MTSADMDRNRSVNDKSQPSVLVKITLSAPSWSCLSIPSMSLSAEHPKITTIES